MSLLRQSPSGPIIGGSEVGNKGMIIKSSTATRVVDNGAISNSVTHEIKKDMSVVDNADTMRPVLDGVSITSQIQIETGFDLEVIDPDFGGDELTVTLQCSRDSGATWVTVWEFLREWPVFKTAHVSILTDALLPTVVTGFVEGDSLTARVTVVGGGGDMEVTSEAPNGTAFCSIRELVA